MLTLARPPVWLGIDPDKALPLVRTANDMVAEYAEQVPSRLYPTATILFVNEDYVVELERCVEALFDL